MMKQTSLAAFFKKPGAAANAPPASAPTTSSELAPAATPAKREPLPLAKPAPKPATAPVEDDDEDEPGQFLPSRNGTERETSSRGRKLGKRRVVIDDTSEDEDDDDDDTPARKPAPKSVARNKKKKPRYSGDSDDDEFVLDDASTGASARMDTEDESVSDTFADTAETSLTSSASRRPPKPRRPAAQPMGKTSSSSGGKALTKAEQAKERDKKEAEERTVPWKFLKDVRDADGNPKGSADYDPRTLLIRKSDWAEMTPFEAQFWTIKQNHFDTVLFFQKGKFSELYEDDAFIGHQEFDLKITRRVKMSMVGVPSTSLEFWISKFLAKGYKVGRVDQAETALGAEMRSKGTLGESSAKAAKAPVQKQKNGKEIVRRELKSVLTSGTITDGSMLTDDGAQCLLVIKERVDASTGHPTYGLVLLDATTADFTLVHFDDDVCRTKLETTVRRTRPKELVFEKAGLAPDTLRLLRGCAPLGCVWTGLKPSTEFVSPDVAQQELRAVLGEDLPDVLRTYWNATETMEALGALWWYLTQLNLGELFTTRNFNTYDPLRRGHALLLDGQTLAHVEVLVNSHGTEEGTLLHLLDRTVTPFGKRLFRQWLTAPLQNIRAINERLDAIEDLMRNPDFEKEMHALSKGLPDLERLISRIHAGSISIKNFRTVIRSFNRVATATDKLAAIARGFEGRLVADLLGAAPAIAAALEDIEADFTGDGSELAPHKGRDKLYDAAIAEIDQAEAALERELEAASDLLKCTCEFRDIGIKDIRQIQVPAKIKVPKDWTKMSSTKEVNRYYTPKSMKLVRALKEAREKETHAKEEFHLRVFEKFDKSYHNLWLPTVKLVSKLDCLLALAKSSAALGDDACRPAFVDAPTAFLNIRNLRHPCIASQSVDDFIPNDVVIGGDAPRTILLSGPNMAGKSTLLRSTCVAVVSAQLGCYVAATAMTLAPVDRIQTRMGASDSIFTHASTFKVEMDDARKTLMESTPRSLVVLDELGRGTSTHDGHAIAFSVLHALATHIQPLTFFATHYSLAPDFAQHPNVAPMFMSTALERDQLIFLYKLKSGTAPRSFGPMVARIAGVSQAICERATKISDDFEQATRKRHQAARGHEGISLCLQADAAWLLRQADGAKPAEALSPSDLLSTIETIRRAVKALGLP